MVKKALSHSSREWTQGGRRGKGLILKYELSSKVSCLSANIVQNCGRMLEQMIQCLVFVVGPHGSPSTDVIYVVNETMLS